MSTVKRFVLGIIAALYIIAPSTLAYAATKTYMLTFNGNCNDSSYTISQTSMRLSQGETYSNLPSPSRKGYKFDGWYTAVSGGNMVSSSTVMGSSDVTVFAH